jgi:hypothetical protein
MEKIKSNSIDNSINILFSTIILIIILSIILSIILMIIFYLFIKQSNIIDDKIFLEPIDESFLYILNNSNYIKKLSKKDLEIRNSLNYKQYINLYFNSLTNFTDTEKNIILEIYKELFNLHFIFREIKINFVKHNNYNIELNCPHTIDNIIILPQEYLSKNILNYNKMKKLIIHEYIHCWQRKNKDLTKKYINKLGFKECKFISEKELHSNNININLASNPDINDEIDYTFNNQLIKLIYNYSTYNNSIKNSYNTIVRDVSIDLNNQMISNFNYENSFNQSQPNEIMAEILSDYFMNIYN